MLEGKCHCTVDIVYQIFCGFIDHITGYKWFLRRARFHAIYGWLLSRVVSANWKQRWTSREVERIGAEVCEF